MNLDLFVPGHPAPQGSKRHLGNGVLVESCKRVGDWRTLIAYTAAQAHPGPPLDGPVAISAVFVMARPKSLPKRQTPEHTKRPDVDKLLRAVLDALSGVVWRDDAQVVDVHAVKRYAEPDDQPGVALRVGDLA